MSGMFFLAWVVGVGRHPVFLVSFANAGKSTRTEHPKVAAIFHQRNYAALVKIKLPTL